MKLIYYLSRLGIIRGAKITNNNGNISYRRIFQHPAFLNPSVSIGYGPLQLLPNGGIKYASSLSWEPIPTFWSN